MNKWQSTLLILLVLVGLILGVKNFATPKKAIVFNGQTARTKGNPDARIKVIEYIDFQ